MEKILLAVGARELEEFLQKKLRSEFKFVGTTVYREGIVRSIGQLNPDIVVIRETLEGKENILTVVYEVRTKYPKVRIVFIAGKREPGDALLATLVNYGVYDILYGEKIHAQSVISLLRKPNEYKDVQHLQPKPVLDEKRNQVLFESPEPKIIEKEIIKEVSDFDPSNEESWGNRSFKYENKEKWGDEIDVQERALEAVTDPFFKKNSGEKTGGQKIVTFIGAKHGVGNTSIAVNVAVQLAKHKNRVIFIEFDDRSPSVNYWYEIGYTDRGIDSAIRGLQENNYKIEEAIVNTLELSKEDSSFRDNFKKFPKTLDFMFFSHEYLTRQRGEIYDLDLRLTKELCFYLLFQLDYDYVILDVPSNIENDTTHNALLYSSKIFFTITQDVSSIANVIYTQNELAKQSMHVSKKSYYIINRYESADLDIDEISDWIQDKRILTIPCFNKEFINANFVGMPVILHSKNQKLKTAFKAIERVIILGGVVT